MAGANHRGDRALPLLGRGVAGSIRSDRPPACELQGGGNCFFLGQPASIGALHIVYSSDRQRLANPPLAIASSGERPRLGKCEGPVIDIT